MFAGADPISVIIITAGVAVLVGVLLRGRRGSRKQARAQSMATHPSAAGPGHLTWAQRQLVAADVAEELAAEGFVCDRRTNATVVQASALDGKYLINVGRSAVLAAYHSNTSFEKLGEFRSSYEAVLAVLGHAELNSPT